MAAIMFYPKFIKDLMVKVFTEAGANVYQNQTPRKKRIAILGHIMYFMHNKPLFFFLEKVLGQFWTMFFTCQLRTI